MKRIQKVGEPFDTFVTDLRNLISTCEYHVEERDNLLREQIVPGIMSDAVREKLVYADGGETKLMLLISVDISRNSEITGQLMQNITVGVDPSNVEQRIHAMNSKQGKVKSKYSDDEATTQQGKCTLCEQTHTPLHCPAYGKICHLCGMTNNFSSVCLQQKPLDMLAETVLSTIYRNNI